MEPPSSCPRGPASKSSSSVTLRLKFALEQRAKDAQVSHAADFDAYARLVGKNSLDRAHEISGVPKPQLEALASALHGPSRHEGDVSLDHGSNQHSNCPSSLIGQP